MATTVEILPDAEAVGATLASRIADGLERSRQQGRPYVLGCPGGRSLQPTYRALAAEAAKRGPGLGPLLIVMMDDYVVERAGDLRPIDPDSHASCARFAREEIAAILSAAGVVDVEIWLPDPQRPQDFDAQITEAGGVDLFLLASGASDGHVAFNPPGTPRTARTRIVELAETTRADNLQTFPAFEAVEDVPRHGVTVGPATIVDSSRELAMVVTGEDKHTAFRRLADAADYDPFWPATVVHGGPPATLYADTAAAQGSR
ncbi:6-phosphogluconolactonase [Aeromicrobium sp. CTD01-1L150]|uniref:6-phosphogluconolactonase n=1 Tax=Aeromicrobium sp. CTD01-1L150 TaxID=3341830 RepID=UPI0035C19500